MTTQNTVHKTGISHHLAEETLTAYATGSLSEAFEVVVASHLTMCPCCREKAKLLDSVGGYFVEQSDSAIPALTATEMLKKCRLSDVVQLDDRTTEQNDQSDKRPCAHEVTRETALRVPLPLARRLPASVDNLPWKPLARGIEQFELGTGSKKDGAFKLLRIQPGTQLIEHEHGDHELTLVLHGSYSDSLGRYSAGDVADLGPEHSHKPVIDSDEPCIALIASNAPARYKGLVGKLIQPFVGI